MLYVVARKLRLPQIFDLLDRKKRRGIEETFSKAETPSRFVMGKFPGRQEFFADAAILLLPQNVFRTLSDFRIRAE